jgi:hypothetical protein
MFLTLMYAKHTKEEVGTLFNNSSVEVQQIQNKSELDMERKTIKYINMDNQISKSTKTESKQPLCY